MALREEYWDARQNAIERMARDQFYRTRARESREGVRRFARGQNRTRLRPCKAAAARSQFAFEGDECGCGFCLRPLEVAGHSRLPRPLIALRERTPRCGQRTRGRRSAW